MTLWQKYYVAKSVDQALGAMQKASGNVRYLAGGTDLILDLRQGRHEVLDTVVDITQIEEMRQIHCNNEYLHVGAAVPLNRLVSSELVHRNARALLEASALIGGPQVRNTATLGGNVAHALPAGDGTIALVTLDADVEVAGLSGTRVMPILELFSGPGQSTLAPSDLLTSFRIPLGDADQGSSFRRVMRPQGVAIAILNMGMWVQRRGEAIADIRCAVGPSGRVPRRMYDAEKQLAGVIPEAGAIKAAIKVMLSEASFRTSRHRATEAYRRQIAGVLFEETLDLAWQRSGGKPLSW